MKEGRSLARLCCIMTSMLATLAAGLGIVLMGHGPAVDIRGASGSESSALSAVPAGEKAIWVFLGEQKAFLTESGTVIRTYRISSGAAQTPTPRGEFRIHKKQKLRISSQAVPYRMPYYMAFTESGSFGLHALPYLGASPETSWYWKEAYEHIGIPLSHGCIRFLPEEAVEVYEWANVGTPVYIRG